ncbi:hypothetical protein [Streptomyces sp. NPDC005407]|uniref:hypothetical protein n=1 Tax=Streptomyces sp. NPDC005407 TaxID=3155340 RepID=UPI0033A10E64
MHERARENGARDGTPILWSARHGADLWINLFFRADEIVSKQQTTWRRYAYALVVCLNFLEQRGRLWFEASTRDYTDFKHWRMADSRNCGRVEGTSFDTDRAGLKRFYAWASSEYEVFNPIPSQSVQSGGHGPGRRDPSRRRSHKVELCLTPTSASWANPIEAQFGPLRNFVMGGSNHPNHTVLASRLQDYLRWRNVNARHPDVLAAQRRERAKVRSERQQRWGRPRPKAA